MGFTDYASSIRLPDCSKWPKLVVKFHVNIITGSGAMTSSFYKELTRNPGIGNTPVWVLFNIWRLEQVKNTNFGMNASKKMLLNATNCQGYSFYGFWVIKGKPTGGGRSPTSSPPPRLGLNLNLVQNWTRTLSASKNFGNDSEIAITNLRMKNVRRLQFRVCRLKM